MYVVEAEFLFVNRKTELHEDVDESAPLQNDGFPPDTHSPQELELFNKDHNNEDT